MDQIRNPSNDCNTSGRESLNNDDCITPGRESLNNDDCNDCITPGRASLKLLSFYGYNWPVFTFSFNVYNIGMNYINKISYHYSKESIREER